MFEEIHLIREWIGAIPLEAPLYPIWGLLIRAIASTGVDILFGASVLSFVAYLINATLLFFSISRFTGVAVKTAERAAVFEEASYSGLNYLVASIGTVAYLLTPAFVKSAISPTPILFAQTFPIAAIFTLSRLTTARFLRQFVSATFIAGVLTALSILNGPIGILPLPLVFFALTIPFFRQRMMIAQSLGISLLGFVLSLTLFSYIAFSSPGADLLRVIGITAHALPSGFLYPGSIVYFLLGVLPVIIATVFIGTGRIKPLVLRTVFFTFWGVASGFLGIGTLISFLLGATQPGELFVEGIIGELGERDVILTDGTFDDLLRFKVPQSVTILKLGHDEKVPQELLDSISDEEVRFAAEMGSIAFVEDWIRRDPYAMKRVLLVTPRIFKTAEGTLLEPRGWCWSGAYAGAPTPSEELKRAWESRWELVANELQGRDKLSWYMRRIFAVQGMRLAERLEADGKTKLAQSVRGIVVGHIDASFSREAETRRKINREKVLASVERLVELDSLDDFARAQKVIELEGRLLPELERSVGDDAAWLVHVLKGELALKKGKEFHLEARNEYRAATMDENSDLSATAGKLLLLDAALRDEESTRQDSLGILRRDRTNRMALAILGNHFAQQGDNVRAESYLRRATSDGEGPVLVEALNDLAEVLSRLGRYDEAFDLSSRVIAHRPNVWTFRETLSAILTRLGRLDEAEAELAEASRLAKEEKALDLARNVLDIDRARILKARGKIDSAYRLFVNDIKSRNLSPAHRVLAEEL